MPEDISPGHGDRDVLRVPDREEIIRFFEEEYGIPRGFFRGKRMIFKKGRVYLAGEDVVLPGRFTYAGIMICRIGRKIKPTTSFIQLVGHLVRKKIVEISEEELKMVAMGYDLEKEAEGGYVVLKCGNDIIGIGLSDGKTIKNQIPKKRRIELLDFKEG